MRKKKNNKMCGKCERYKALYLRKWRRKDGRIGQQWKYQADHGVCLKCWRAIENSQRGRGSNDT